MKFIGYTVQDNVIYHHRLGDYTSSEEEEDEEEDDEEEEDAEQENDEEDAPLMSLKLCLWILSHPTVRKVPHFLQSLILGWISG